MHDFTNIGVFLQLTAMLVLLVKIVCTRDCTGLSGRTQLLMALVFSTRFLDLPDEFKVSMSSFVMKIVYLFIAYLTVVAIFVICRRTYEQKYDTFRIDYLGGTCLTAAMITSHKHLDILSILWYLSVYLETCAVLPQIYFTSKAQYAGSSLVFYVGMLASYRIFHVVHWAYSYWYGSLTDSLFVVANGCAQLIVYCGYFGWMVPLFKAQYGHLRRDDTTSDVTKVCQDLPAQVVTSNGIKSNCEC